MPHAKELRYSRKDLLHCDTNCCFRVTNKDLWTVIFEDKLLKCSECPLVGDVILISKKTVANREVLAFNILAVTDWHCAHKIKERHLILIYLIYVICEKDFGISLSKLDSFLWYEKELYNPAFRI
jgi:hypothetical protein